MYCCIIDIWQAAGSGAVRWVLSSLPYWSHVGADKFQIKSLTDSVVLFFPPHYLAQLRAKSLGPAPAFILLTLEPPHNFIVYMLTALARAKDEILSVRHGKHSLGLGADEMRRLGLS